MKFLVYCGKRYPVSEEFILGKLLDLHNIAPKFLISSEIKLVYNRNSFS